MKVIPRERWGQLLIEIYVAALRAAQLDSGRQYHYLRGAMHATRVICKCDGEGKVKSHGMTVSLSQF